MKVVNRSSELPTWIAQEPPTFGSLMEGDVFTMGTGESTKRFVKTRLAYGNNAVELTLGCWASVSNETRVTLYREATLVLGPAS